MCAWKESQGVNQRHLRQTTRPSSSTVVLTTTMGPPLRGGPKTPSKLHQKAPLSGHEGPRKAIKKKPRDPWGRNGAHSERRARVALQAGECQNPVKQEGKQEHRRVEKFKKARDPNGRNGAVNSSRSALSDFDGEAHEQNQGKQHEHPQRTEGEQTRRREKRKEHKRYSFSDDAGKEEQQPSKSQKQKQQQLPKQQKEQQQKQQLSQAVFVRNLPFDVDEDAVSLLLKQFGSVKSTFVVKNEEGEGRGAAFVYFEDAVLCAGVSVLSLQASAQKAIAASAAYESELERLSGRQQKRLSHLLAAKHRQEQQQQQEAEAASGASLFLRGRRLQILPALNRDHAKRLTATKQQERAVESAKKRGLTLAYEGLPRRPFEGLGPSEEAIARAAYQETKEKLKNPNIFVNKTRLCLRNLPTWADANFLRERLSGLLAPILKSHAESPAAAAAAAVAAAAAEQNEPEKQQQPQKIVSVSSSREWKAKAAAAIKKVAIIREKRETSKRHKAGAPRRSLGFCFIDLSCEFAQVLQLLRAVRDSKEFFSTSHPQWQRDTNRTPIVQFALEDARKVKIKTERIAAFAKLLRKRQEEKGSEDPKSATKVLKRKTYSRGRRQREKRRQERLAAEQAAAAGQRGVQAQQLQAQRHQEEKEDTSRHVKKMKSKSHGQSSQFSDDEADAPRYVKEHANSRKKRKKQSEDDGLEETELRKRIKELLRGAN